MHFILLEGTSNIILLTAIFVLLEHGGVTHLLETIGENGRILAIFHHSEILLEVGIFLESVASFVEHVASEELSDENLSLIRPSSCQYDILFVDL